MTCIFYVRRVMCAKSVGATSSEEFPATCKRLEKCATGAASDHRRSFAIVGTRRSRIHNGTDRIRTRPFRSLSICLRRDVTRESDRRFVVVIAESVEVGGM